MLWYAILPLSVLLLLGVAFLLYAYRTAFYSPRRHRSPTDGYAIAADPALDGVRARHAELKAALLAAPFEEVSIKSRDGLRLVGRYYEHRAGAPLCIAFHGYRSGPVGDSAGAYQIAKGHDYNLLTVYQRAHGLSEGRTITFGIREAEDLLLWVTYATERFGSEIPIFLSGISMGGATVLTAASLPLPENVVGIIADCAYTSPRDILRKVTRDMHLPVALSYRALCLAARLFGGFHPEERSPIEAIKKAGVPILLIHGEADDFVPFSMVHELHAACASECRLVTFPDAGHGLSYLVDSERYEREVVDFEERCLARLSRAQDIKN